jgi:MerR family transcriptional regulator/heat shock protein HspR
LRINDRDSRFMQSCFSIRIPQSKIRNEVNMVAREHRLFMISVVSEMLGIHPQTLRIYEREGFIKPKRSGGNTRLYSEEDVEKLEMILRLTRELGVNLAGVEVILSMRDKMDKMEREREEAIQLLRDELEREIRRREEMRTAIVPVRRIMVKRT